MRGRISQEERRASAKTYNDLVEAAKAAGTLALPTLVPVSYTHLTLPTSDLV